MVRPKAVSKEWVANLEELYKFNETASEHFRACWPEWTAWGHLGFSDSKFLAK